MSSFVSFGGFLIHSFSANVEGCKSLERRRKYIICNHCVQGCNLINCYTTLCKKNITRQASSLKLNPDDGDFSACLSIVKKG